MERDWDDEFFRMTGFNGSFEDYSEDNFTDAEEREMFLELVKRREQMLYVQHEVMVNAFQAKSFLCAITGIFLGMSTLMMLAWSVWYWVK